MKKKQSVIQTGFVVNAISLRDYFAAHAPPAPQQWVEDSISNSYAITETLVAWAYHYADVMLKERLHEPE